MYTCTFKTRWLISYLYHLYPPHSDSSLCQWVGVAYQLPSRPHQYWTGWVEDIKEQSESNSVTVLTNSDIMQFRRELVRTVEYVEDYFEASTTRKFQQKFETNRLH